MSFSCRRFGFYISMAFICISKCFNKSGEGYIVRFLKEDQCHERHAALGKNARELKIPE